MKRLFAATAALALLAAPVAQATGPLPNSVLDFVDYICGLEDDGVIPPPFPPNPNPNYLDPSDVIFEQAFSAYVDAGLIDHVPSCCDTQRPTAN